MRSHRSRRGIVTGLLFALSTSITASAVAETYYVDNQSPNCSYAGPGTEAQPYCTIATAVTAHNGPGTTIIVKPGIYREQVTLPASGAAGLPFVIRAAGPGVVVDGADSFAAEHLWVQRPLATLPDDYGVQMVDDPWLASGVTWAPEQVFVDGVRLTRSTSAPELLPPNAFTWVAGQGLYVNIGGFNPGLRQTLVGRRSHGFNMFSKSWITIEGFEIARSESRGVYMQVGCSEIVVSRNQVSFTGSYGIQAVGGVNAVIQENVVSDCGLHGIGLTAGATGCVVRNNESFRNVDPSIRRANGIYLYASSNNTLYGNRLHDNQDTGMQFSGGADNCLAYNNSSWNNGDHGYDHLDVSGTVHIHDLAFGNFKDGFSIEGNAPYTRLHNCIAVDNGVTTGEFNLWVNDLSSVGFVSDFNIFWNSTAQEPIKYITTKHATLASYQAASGQDAHSRQADPKFVDPANGNFRVSAGSPAIDAATSEVSSWPVTDAAGNVRVDDPLTANSGSGLVAFADIGVLEYVPATDYPPVVSCPSVVNTTPGSTVSFTVTASDPNGQPIQSLVMVPISLPPNSGAVFTTNATNTVGQFTWDVGSQTGDFRVRFVASNTLTGSRHTTIKVKTRGRAEALPSGEEAGAGVLALSNGFPNPSQGEVEFALDVPQASQVRWAVFDLQGRMVWSEARSVAAGRTRLRWDGTTASRGRAATGVYMVQAWVDGAQFSRRIVRF